MGYYIISEELEYDWIKWSECGCQDAWQRLSEQLYDMCYRISIRFRPKSEDEHMELTHEAFISTLTKIKNGKLVFEPGRAPVFNLLTTTIFRHLYSLKNRNKRGVNALYEYTRRYLSDSRVRKKVLPSQLNQIYDSLSSTGSQGLKYVDESEAKS